MVNKDHHISVFGRTITIADCYDTITTPRAYRAVNLTPFDGVCFLLANMGTKFDPILVKLFIDLLGVYPPGTMVRSRPATWASSPARPCPPPRWIGRW